MAYSDSPISIMTVNSNSILTQLYTSPRYPSEMSRLTHAFLTNDSVVTSNTGERTGDAHNLVYGCLSTETPHLNSKKKESGGWRKTSA